MIDLIRTKTSLEKNGFFTYLFENRDEAVDYFLHFAESGKSFGFLLAEIKLLQMASKPFLELIKLPFL